MAVERNLPVKHRLLILVLTAIAWRARAATNDEALPARFDQPLNLPYSPAQHLSSVVLPWRR